MEQAQFRDRGAGGCAQHTASVAERLGLTGPTVLYLRPRTTDSGHGLGYNANLLAER